MTLRTLNAIILAALCLPMLLASAQAETPKDLKWSDLIPAKIEVVTSLDRLDAAQLKDIEYIAWVRQVSAAGMMEEDAPAAQEAVKIAARLTADGLDVPELIEQIGKKRERQLLERQRAVKDLDGTYVRIPGYAIPVELNGTNVKEFLLVPYVGACIHTPPPPPNQIVYVEADKAVELAGTFAPVSVTGRMSVQDAHRSIFLVDGTADIDIGYSLRGMRVEAISE